MIYNIRYKQKVTMIFLVKFILYFYVRIKFSPYVCVCFFKNKKNKKDGFKMELESLDFRYRNPKF